MQGESAFKRRIVRAYLQRFPRAWYTYLVPHAGQRPGLPDLLFMPPGRPLLWLEAKMDGEALSTLQQDCASRLITAGERWVCAWRHGPRHVQLADRVVIPLQDLWPRLVPSTTGPR